jgi:N-acetylglucosamine kinase-like BadF-type ATPase
MSLAGLFLGVDGGQSSTTALIADQSGSILGVGNAGPCNHVGAAEGPGKLKRAVSDCLSQACKKAGLDPLTVSFVAACFGMSGGPHDKQNLLEELIRSPLLFVTDDALIALSGSLAGQPGVVTIAGTGSMCFGRGSDGKSARAGGWGYVFGDEGGAFDIVRRALRAALRYEEGWGEATGLVEALLRETGEPSINSVLHAFYRSEWPRSRVAQLAPLVSGLSAAGDTVALGILEEEGLELARYAMAVGQQLRTGNPARFSYIGGVFQSAILLDQFRSEIEAHKGCEVVAPIMGPAEGALLEAYRIAGVSPDLNKLLTSNF